MLPNLKCTQTQYGLVDHADCVLCRHVSQHALPYTHVHVTLNYLCILRANTATKLLTMATLLHVQVHVHATMKSCKSCSSLCRLRGAVSGSIGSEQTASHTTLKAPPTRGENVSICVLLASTSISMEIKSDSLRLRSR